MGARDDGRRQSQYTLSNFVLKLYFKLSDVVIGYIGSAHLMYKMVASIPTSYRRIYYHSGLHGIIHLIGGPDVCLTTVWYKV